MRRYTTIRLRFWLPIFIFAMFTLSLTFSTIQRHRDFRKNLEKSTITALRERLARAGTQIQISLQNGNVEQTWGQVATLGSIPEIQSAVFVDEEALVLHGSRMEWMGHPVSEVLQAFERSRFLAVQGSRVPEFHFSADGNRILAYYPIILPARSGEIRSARIGGLLVDFDLSQIESEYNRAYVLRGAAEWGVALLLMLWLYLAVRRWLTRPLRHLENTAMLLSTGDFSARSAVDGRGELADFSATFNRMAEEVQRHSGRLRAVLDAATESMIVATDAAGLVTLFNPGAERMLGYTADEVVGQKTPMLWHVEAEVAGRLALRGGDAGREAKECDLFAAVVRQGRDAPAEWTIVRKGGELRTAHLVVTSIRRPDGEISGHLGVAQDITRQKVVEAQLRQSQKMEGIGQLAGGIAHDFNNLLTVINGYSELILSEIGDADPHRDELTEIRKSGERAAVLTKQLLAFSRKQFLQPKVVDLNDVIANIEDMVRRMIGEQFAMVVVPGKDLWRVKVDPGQVEQILMNLALNARDAMPSGGTVTIETANVEMGDLPKSEFQEFRPCQHALLTVADTGTGMDRKTAARVFEPFFTTKGPGKGTGLGLSMVFGIVEQSRGHILVESEPECGSTFKIYFPRTEEDPDPACPSTTASSAVSGGQEILLLTEDESTVLALTRKFLVAQGYTVLEANTGSEALRIAAEHKGAIHLLLSDVVMPGMSGPELADRIEATRPGIKVLFMSGHPQKMYDDDGFTNGRDGFLQKPFGNEALARKVREILDQPSA